MNKKHRQHAISSSTMLSWVQVSSTCCPLVYQGRVNQRTSNEDCTISWLLQALQGNITSLSWRRHCNITGEQIICYNFYGLTFGVGTLLSFIYIDTLLLVLSLSRTYQEQNYITVVPAI